MRWLAIWGAVVLLVDALQADLLQDIPFSAVDDIFVVSGSDELNVRVAISVKQSAEAVQAKRVKLFKATYLKKLWHQCFNRICTDKPSTCYVRLYEHELHQVLQTAFAITTAASKDNEQETEKKKAKSVCGSEVTLKVFNTDQNAARLLVQDELCRKEIRPSKLNEVAMYTIVGFGPMGQTGATTLTQLAHFENFKRSRLLVLADSTPCGLNVRKFLARHPKFTHPGAGLESMSKIQFDPEDDDWKPSPDSPGLNFATQCRFTSLPPCPNDPKFLAKLHQLMQQTGNRLVKPVVIVCLEDDAAAFTWASVFEHAWQDFVYREGLAASNAHPPMLPIYVWLPDQAALRDIVDVAETDHVLTTIRSFGQATESSSVTAIKGAIRAELVKINSASYSAALKTLKRGQPEEQVVVQRTDSLPSYPPFLELEKSITDNQSNLFAADHAIIKFRVAGGTFDRSLEEKMRAVDCADVNPTKCVVDKDRDPPDEFVFVRTENIQMQLPRLTEHSGTQSVPRPTMIETLGIMEHNRWSSEMLLRNYSYVTEEQMSFYLSSRQEAKEYRTPVSFYQRSTLTAWDDLQPEQQLKDIMQAYYVMYYLNKLDSVLRLT